MAYFDSTTYLHDEYVKELEITSSSYTFLPVHSVNLLVQNRLNNHVLSLGKIHNRNML